MNLVRRVIECIRRMFTLPKSMNSWDDLVRKIGTDQVELVIDRAVDDAWKSYGAFLVDEMPRRIAVAIVDAVERMGLHLPSVVESMAEKAIEDWIKRASADDITADNAKAILRRALLGVKQ